MAKMMRTDLDSELALIDRLVYASENIFVDLDSKLQVLKSPKISILYRSLHQTFVLAIKISSIMLARFVKIPYPCIKRFSPRLTSGSHSPSLILAFFSRVPHYCLSPPLFLQPHCLAKQLHSKFVEIINYRKFSNTTTPFKYNPLSNITPPSEI